MKSFPSSLLIVIATLAVPASGLAHAAPSMSSERGELAHVAEPPVEEVVRMDFEVRHGVRPGTVTLAGQMTLEPHRTGHFSHRTERTADRPASSVELSVTLVPRGADEYLVRLFLEQETDGGEHIEWGPSIVVKKGQPATASVTWGTKSGRTISLTLR
jgi:hypothetical protein